VRVQFGVVLYLNGSLSSNITQLQATLYVGKRKGLYNRHTKCFTKTIEIFGPEALAFLFLPRKTQSVSVPPIYFTHTHTHTHTHARTRMLRSAAHALATSLMHTDRHTETHAAYLPLGLISGVCLQVFTKTLA
jgi:hypothetical protein